MSPRLTIPIVIIIALATSPAKSVQSPTFSDCPQFKNGKTWRDYIKTPKRIYAVEFRFAKLVGDAAAMGNVPSNYCYVGMYSKEKGYISAQLRPPPPHPDQNVSGAPGNPDEYEVNIHGEVFLFDDYGVLYDRKGRPVGVLSCVMSTTEHCADF